MFVACIAFAHFVPQILAFSQWRKYRFEPEGTKLSWRGCTSQHSEKS